MKYLSMILICFMLITVGCETQNNPENLVKEYLSAIDHLNYEKAKKMLVPNDENVKSIDNIKKFGDRMTESEREQYISNKKTYNFIQKELSSDSAKIIATNTQGTYTVVIEFDLKKVDNKWLISTFKSN